MQLSRQSGEAGAVVFALASVAFTLKVDNSVQRLQRPPRAQRGLRMSVDPPAEATEETEE
jgi:hypothetical protein